jgi:hypothetical protein
MGMDLNPAVMGLVGGAVLGTMLSRQQKGVSPPPQQAPSPAPQPAHGPDMLGILGDMQGAASAQPSTFLSGPGGVDPKKLKTIRPQLYTDDQDNG